VQSSIKEALIARLLERIALIKIGDTVTEEFVNFEGPQMGKISLVAAHILSISYALITTCTGPVVSKGQYDKIWGIIDSAKSSGLNIIYGGDRSLVSHLSGGYYIPPTVILDPPTDAFVWREEIFGPVLCIREFNSEEEAVAHANDSEYGLGAAVFSKEDAKCERVSRAFRAGIVWRNCCQPAFIQVKLPNLITMSSYAIESFYSDYCRLLGAG
jgi:hypothetical protein